MTVEARIIAPKSVSEGVGQFTFKIEWQDVSTLSTTYTASSNYEGSATSDRDFRSFSASSMLSVSQSPTGPYSEKLTVSIIDDLKKEAKESFSITVTASDTRFANGFDTFTFNVAILDNDTPTNGRDVLKGNGSGNTLEGLKGDDTLYGFGGNDKLFGDEGADKLYGGQGRDVLTGGAGKDTFFFDTKLDARTNADQIKDFVAKDDTIALDDKFFSGLKVGKLKSWAFKDTAIEKVDANDRILYGKKGDLSFDQDGSGTKYGAIKFAHLDGHPALTAADFLVV